MVPQSELFAFTFSPPHRTVYAVPCQGTRRLPISPSGTQLSDTHEGAFLWRFFFPLQVAFQVRSSSSYTDFHRQWGCVFFLHSTLFSVGSSFQSNFCLFPVAFTPYPVPLEIAFFLFHVSARLRRLPLVSIREGLFWCFRGSARGRDNIFYHTPSAFLVDAASPHPGYPLADDLVSDVAHAFSALSPFCPNSPLLTVPGFFSLQNMDCSQASGPDIGHIPAPILLLPPPMIVRCCGFFYPFRALFSAYPECGPPRAHGRAIGRPGPPRPAAPPANGVFLLLCNGPRPPPDDIFLPLPTFSLTNCLSFSPLFSTL